MPTIICGLWSLAGHVDHHFGRAAAGLLLQADRVALGFHFDGHTRCRGDVHETRVLLQYIAQQGCNKQESSVLPTHTQTLSLPIHTQWLFHNQMLQHITNCQRTGILYIHYSIPIHTPIASITRARLTLLVSGRTRTWKACPWWRMDTSVIRIFKLAMLRSFITESTDTIIRVTTSRNT